MEKKIEAVVAGHICLDLTPKFGQSAEETGSTISLADILAPGKIIQMDGIELSTGGAVANTGIALSLMGIDASLMGLIGNDPFGSIVKQIVEGFGAKESLIQSDKVNTSYTVVLVPPGIDRIFLHDSGANDQFGAADIDLEVIKNARLFHFGYPPLMKRMQLDDGCELIELFQSVKDIGVTTSLDMALPDISSEAGKVNWRKVLEGVLPYVDIVLPSLEETMLMLDRDRYMQRLQELKGGDFLQTLCMDSVKEYGHTLLEMGASIVAVKCGEHGIIGFSGDKDSVQNIGPAAPADPVNWSNRELFSDSYHVENVLSSTGAGDNSIGGFLAGLLRGLSFEETLELACMAGANATKAYSAVGGVVPIEEMRKEIASNPPKNKRERETEYWSYLPEKRLWKGGRESVL